MKKFLSMILALTMSLALAVPAFAATTSEPQSEALSEDYGIMPFSNRQVIRNQDITTEGTSWVQPFGYGSYRIWVKNTTNEEMTITHCAGISSVPYKVPANTAAVVCVENHAIPYVSHTLDFSIPSGAGSEEVLGTVAVRISTVDQYE